MKNLYIAEKPSVARQFADVLGVKGNAGAGYLESEDSVVTWCVGHLITMSYPDAYDEKLKKWCLYKFTDLPLPLHDNAKNTGHNTSNRNHAFIQF